MIDRTHDPNRTSWVKSANEPGCDFPIQNLPFVNFKPKGETRARPGVAIGDQILDLERPFDVRSMDAVVAMPREQRVELRNRIADYLERQEPDAARDLHPTGSVAFDVPCAIGDYTDFYASVYHATNVGRLFRPDNPLLPNYKWVPIAYHGRASSIAINCARPVRRPSGQTAGAAGEPPAYGPTRKLDYELEVGAIIGAGNPQGAPVPVDRALESIFGLCLLNDWSARDIQAWEYQPLGPFLAKNFATSLSPYVVTTEALEPFLCEPDPRSPGDPEPLPYLAGGRPAAYDIHLEVWLKTAQMTEPVRLSRGNFRSMYWTFAQMIAHHTSNGCNLRSGDLIGSGTVSGPDPENRGCLLELTGGGKNPIQLPNGETRAFVEDMDEVILRGWCEAPGFRRIGFGECRGLITSR